MVEPSILEWKEKYDEIYELRIGDKEGEFLVSFIFRLIGRAEYEQLLALELEEGQMQEAVCHTVTLHPPFDFENDRAGFAEVLYQHIMDLSGFQPNQPLALLQHYRDEMLVFDYQADCIIKEAFPEFDLEEISNWTARKTMYYLSRAEWILQNLRGVPLNPHEVLEGQPGPIPQKPMQMMPPAPIHEQTPVSAPSEPKKPGEHLTEEEVMQMLQASMASHPVAPKQIDPRKQTQLNDLFPELSWFKGEEEMKGDYE